VPARTGENLGRVLRLGAGDTVHIRAYKFNPIYARTERFDEYGKTAVLIATARRKFGRVYAATAAINITSASVK